MQDGKKGEPYGLLAATSPGNQPWQNGDAEAMAIHL
jgi:hypothetical protein